MLYTSGVALTGLQVSRLTFACYVYYSIPLKSIWKYTHIVWKILKIPMLRSHLLFEAYAPPRYCHQIHTVSFSFHSYDADHVSSTIDKHVNKIHWATCCKRIYFWHWHCIGIGFLNLTYLTNGYFCCSLNFSQTGQLCGASLIV